MDGASNGSSRRALPLLHGIDGYTRTLLASDRYVSAPAKTKALPPGEAALAVVHHEFIRTDSIGTLRSDRDEQYAARMCWDQLHKEYALADLSRWRERKVGLRWRTEAEVLSGKGQFQCAALSCDGVLALHSYELPFRYLEKGLQKEALVKVRVCGNCAPKLFGQPSSAPKAASSKSAYERTDHSHVKHSRRRTTSRSRSPLDPDKEADSRVGR